MVCLRSRLWPGAWTVTDKPLFPLQATTLPPVSFLMEAPVSRPSRSGLKCPSLRSQRLLRCVLATLYHLHRVILLTAPPALFTDLHQYRTFADPFFLMPSLLTTVLLVTTYRLVTRVRKPQYSSAANALRLTLFSVFFSVAITRAPQRMKVRQVLRVV